MRPKTKVYSIRMKIRQKTRLSINSIRMKVRPKIRVYRIKISPKTVVLVLRLKY